MRWALQALAIAVLLPTSSLACEATTDGIGLDDRTVEAAFTNTGADQGRHESWAAEGAELIFHAGFAQLTDEYGHNILGPVKDAKALTIHVRLPGSNSITCPAEAILPAGEVFEDIAPRLADLDGDGMPEIIVVQSSTTLGAKLAIYDRHARLIAATPNIGRSNRCSLRSARPTWMATGRWNWPMSTGPTWQKR